MNDGGPAFPVSCGTGPISANFVSPGMSLRDYFAAQALQAIILKGGMNEEAFAPLCANPNHIWKAYAYADSMITQRNSDMRDCAKMP